MLKLLLYCSVFVVHGFELATMARTFRVVYKGYHGLTAIFLDVNLTSVHASAFQASTFRTFCQEGLEVWFKRLQYYASELQSFQ